MLRDPGAPGLSPPQVVAVAKAIACELPAQRAQPLARYSIADIQRVLVAEGVVPRVSASSIWRWLDADALRPWRHRSWIFPRDPAFLAKAGVVLDLYQGRWEGQPLGAREYVVSADEKTSIQARGRCHPSAPPGPNQPQRVEHEYARAGALAYLAGWDVFGAHLIGQPVLTTGIEPFKTLVDKVMTQPPYRDAERVFWLVDNGSSHHPATFPARLQGWFEEQRSFQIQLPADVYTGVRVGTEVYLADQKVGKRQFLFRYAQNGLQQRRRDFAAAAATVRQLGQLYFRHESFLFHNVVQNRETITARRI